MKKYLVIGNPIKHSLSPELHNFWIKNNNIDAIYEKKKLNEDELVDLISEVRSKRIHGLNVTVPFKRAIIPFVDKLTSESEKTLSINTIYLIKDKIIGHNTDSEGFERSIKESKINLVNKKIFILGAGGVVPSLIYALKKMRVMEIFVSNRTKKKVENLKDLFKDINIVDWGKIPEFDIIINATSIGLKDGDKIDLDLSKTGKNKLFYDVIYKPKKTNFLKMGEKLGNKIENGRSMFIYQASASFKVWHGIEPIINEEVFKIIDQ
jgi:shikimate dehydrogenase